MGLSVDVTTLLDRLCDAVSKRRECNREICKAAYDCIRNEKSNFERIVAKKPYENDPREPKARTQKSYEELSKAMTKLSRVRKFRRVAERVKSLCETELARPADEREAVEILDVISKFESRLAEYDSRS